MNIPSAEKFLEHFDFRNQELGIDVNYPMIERCMIDFAKLHVQAALVAASENADVRPIDVDFTGTIWGVDSDTILNTYPLENIK